MKLRVFIKVATLFLLASTGQIIMWKLKTGDMTDLSLEDEQFLSVIKGRNESTLMSCLDLKTEDKRAVSQSPAPDDGRTKIFETFYKPIRPQNISICNRLASGDRLAIREAERRTTESERTPLHVKSFTNIKNCQKFKKDRGYIDHPLTQAEKDFPLAFGIFIEKDVEQFERLFRALYRPQNYYCIHFFGTDRPVDALAVLAIAGCFNNVVVPPEAVNVIKGTFSALEAQLICMRHIWEFPDWKYYINLSEFEFPLKTNLEMVKILDAMQGASVAEATSIRTYYKKYYERWQGMDSPPHWIWLTVGSVHVAVNRHFIDFCLHDSRSHDFIEYLKEVQYPEQLYFTSLQHNPHLGIPGAFKGEPEEYPLHPYFVLFRIQVLFQGVWTHQCEGKYQNFECVFGVGDIQRTSRDLGLFVSKLKLDFHYIAYECIEEILYQRTWDQYLHDTPVDTRFYELLDHVRLQVKLSQ